MRFRTGVAAIALVGCIVGASSTRAAVEVVNSFQPLVGPTTPNQWYAADVRPGGTASVVSLAGQGGNLENNQPLPIGAAKLTTDSTTAAKAEVYTYGSFGVASQVLADASLAYSYFKVGAGGGPAAPALKLLISAPAGGPGASDRFGALVYEPYWNDNGGLGVPTSDAWTSVSIDENTGSGSDAAGGWWWNGGFGVANGAGGPPLRSLAEWAVALGADPSFANATVIGIGMGIGTFNPSETNYFDDVSFDSGSVDVTYDFEPVPEAASLCMWSLLGLTAAGLIWYRSSASQIAGPSASE